jgi:hypothetical protein
MKLKAISDKQRATLAEKVGPSQQVATEKIARRAMKAAVTQRTQQFGAQFAAMVGVRNELITYLLQRKKEGGGGKDGYNQQGIKFLETAVTATENKGDFTYKENAHFSFALSFVLSFLTPEEQRKVKAGKPVSIIGAVERALQNRTIKGATGRRYVDFAEMLGLFAAGKLTKNAVKIWQLKDKEGNVTGTEELTIKVLTPMTDVTEATLGAAYKKLSEKRDKFGAVIPEKTARLK